MKLSESIEVDKPADESSRGVLPSRSNILNTSSYPLHEVKPDPHDQHIDSSEVQLGEAL